MAAAFTKAAISAPENPCASNTSLSMSTVLSIGFLAMCITELFQDALCAYIDGISVVSFNDPALALEHYKQNQQNYALIISDMRMPTMSAMQLLRSVKTLNPYVRRILLSAFDMQAVPDLQQKLKEGIIDSYIQKPVTMRRLCQKVKDEVQIYQTKNIHMILKKNIKV